MITIKDMSKKREFLERLIYAKQFNADSYKLVFHIVNTCYKLVNGNREKLYKIISHYLFDGENIQAYLSNVLDQYDPAFYDMFRYNCFTQIEEVLTPEDMYFMKSRKRRLVTLREYKFLLQRITKHVFKSKGHKSVMVNNYFLRSGLKGDYKRNTVKSLCRNKLAHMLQVCQKHQYLHITYNSKNQRVVQIGPDNPFYMLSSVPDVEEQQVSTHTDRVILELESNNKLLKSTMSLLQEELEEDRVKIETLAGQVESLQSEKELCVEMLRERDEEIDKLTVVPDYKVEGSWITYNLDGYGPIKLSLN